MHLCDCGDARPLTFVVAPRDAGSLRRRTPVRTIERSASAAIPLRSRNVPGSPHTDRRRWIRTARGMRSLVPGKNLRSAHPRRRSQRRPRLLELHLRDSEHEIQLRGRNDAGRIVTEGIATGQRNDLRPGSELIIATHDGLGLLFLCGVAKRSSGTPLSDVFGAPVRRARIRYSRSSPSSITA